MRFDHVESKLGEGDLGGAARLLFSSDVVALQKLPKL